MARKSDRGPLAAQFNLARFTSDLIGDLQSLRRGEISIRDARARAELARQVLRSVHYVVVAQRFIEGRAKELPPLPATSAEGADV